MQRNATLGTRLGKGKATRPCHIIRRSPGPSRVCLPLVTAGVSLCGHGGFHGRHEVLCVLETVNKKVRGGGGRLPIKLTQTLNLRLLEGSSCPKRSQTANRRSAGRAGRAGTVPVPVPEAPLAATVEALAAPAQGGACRSFLSF